MYKKLLWLLVMSLGMFTMVSIASAASLESVWFRFCDDTNGDIYLANKKVISVKPWQDNEMCVTFSNGSDEKVKVKYGLSYWLLNEWGTQVCDQDSSRTNKFSRFFVQPSDSTFTLEAKEQKTIKVQIKVPVWVNGMQYWCLINTVEGMEGPVQKTVWSMFGVVVRKVFPLNLFVGEPWAIKNTLTLKNIEWWIYSTNSKIKAEIKNGNDLDISAHIKNEWNVTQTIAMSGTVNNFFGFEKVFTIQEIKLLPWEEKNVTANVGVIPWYKGLFTVNINAKGTPFFEFDVSGLDETIKNWTSLTESATIYAFSWISIIAIAAIILVLLMIIKPRKKHAQAA